MKSKQEGGEHPMKKWLIAGAALALAAVFFSRHVIEIEIRRDRDGAEYEE